MKDRLKATAFLIILLILLLALVFGRICTECLFDWVAAFCFAMALAEIVASYIVAWRCDRKAALTAADYNLRADQTTNPWPAVAQSIVLLTAIVIVVAWPLSLVQIIFVLFVTFAADIAAYLGGLITGKLVGHHRVKWLANISAKKTHEGFFWGTIGGWLTAAIYLWLAPTLSGELSCVIFGVIGPFVAFAGDLLGSSTKRGLHVKDSNEVLVSIPFLGWLETPLKGHGGYLDRFDSFSLGIVVFTLLQLL